MQDVVPMLSYENGIIALEWLKKAFGFEEDETMRFYDSEGRVSHAELRTGNGIIMIAASTPGYENNNKHRQHCEQADKWLQVPWIINGLLVYVDDVDAHFKNARDNGAEILSEIEDSFPGKRYRCADIEGQRWMFMQKEKVNNG